MTNISSLMTDDHRACDEPLVELENHVGAEAWDAAETAFESFRSMTLRHLRREEEVLFPAFEEATGMVGGPTAVMRSEHEQMRAVIEQLADAVAQRDGARALGLTESYMVLVQQHNMKEEQILYPMADQHLDPPAQVEKLRAVID